MTKVSPFTAHNILLDNGKQTNADADAPLTNTEPWFLAAKRCLNAIYPDGFSGLRIVDLGCLEGGYTVEFARMGFAESLGIEVRESNFSNCEYIKKNTSLPNLRFVKDDVWNLERYGQFDVIFCSGVLYHLYEPKKYLELMSRVAKRAIIINTHFSSDAKSVFNTSPPCINEGLAGRMWDEPGSNDDNKKWSSWKNPRSFWLMKPDLLQAIKSAGFNLVFEQFDFLGNDIKISINEGYYKTHERGMFVGLKV